MNDALAAEKFRCTGLEKQLYMGIAEKYRDMGNVLYFAEDMTPGSIRELADAIADACGGIAGVLAGNDEDGYNLCFVSRTDDLKRLGQGLRQLLGARGGGKPGFFQGSVQATRQQLLDFPLD